MRVFVLELDGVNALARALERVQDCPEVVSCSVDQPERRLRFVAPPKEAAALVERIYLEGGLRWCSAHRFWPRGA